MRIRTVKPAFWTSLDITSLAIRTRLHFIGIWNYADDAGRGIDDPHLIKAALWPRDERVTWKQVDAMQAELASHHLIVRYMDGPRPYFEIPNWTKHQRIDKPQDSTIPPAPIHDASGNVPGTVGDTSRLEGKGKEEEGNGESKAATRALNPVTHDQLYLAERIGSSWGKPLSPAAIQKLNNVFGTVRVTEALRSLHGFPPEEAVRAPFAYLEAICKEAV